MSLLRNLLNKFCPNGVEEFTLKEIGEIQGVGVDKKIVPGEKEVLLLNYMDVYNNRCLSKDKLSMVVTASDHKISQCNILYGDVFITPTSETIDDIGHAAVAMENIPMAVYSYHVWRFRLFLPSIVSSHYISYYFRTKIFQDQVVKYATGLTRFGLTKGKFENLKILFPPLKVQEEIVRVLDKFTLLKAELEAELEARTMQYEHYRDALLDFSNSLTTVQPTILENLLNKFGEANQMLLDELVSHNLGGGTPSKAISSYWGGEIPWASVKDIVGKGMFIDETKDSITEKGLKNSSSNLIPSGWLIICTRINPGVCAISTKDVAINQDLRALKLHDFVNTKFLWHYLQTIRIIGKGTTVKGISVDELGRIPVPVPPLPVQEAIVDILDRFEAIVHDIQDGLPAEIALRQKQYEYYRDKLLTFEPLETETKAA